MEEKKYQLQKIFIAGASGLAGSAIKRALTKENNKSSQKKFLILSPSSSELDLANFISVEAWFKKNSPHIVVIAAGKVGGILANKTQPTEFILENLKIQTNIIELSKKYKVKKLLFLGSSCIYPKFSSQPIIEENLLDSQLESSNQFYAIAKIAGIKLCEALVKQYSFNAICLMPTNLYGPGDNYNPMNSHVMPALIKKIFDAKEKNLAQITCWGTGSPLREFLYVDDLAEACLFALENWNINENSSPKDKFGKPLYWLNVGSSNEISIKNLVLKISQIVGYKGNILWDKNKPDGTPRKKLDTSRMSNLGWQSKVNLDQGISLTLESYKKELENNNLRI
ncbi:GDP-L-fucose synthase [Prochlorococcus sp. AH-716-P05]|nr:GDP-L-fucose synthase [Prochlorococcus sp. AH-716-P05]